MGTMAQCPFCGGKPEAHISNNHWYVECNECGARTDEYIFESAARSAWNVRHDPLHTDYIIALAAHFSDAFNEWMGGNYEPALSTEKLEEFLDSTGNLAEGNTIYERVMSVIRHYATQVGRWSN